MRGINAISDLISEESATSEVKLAIGGATVEGSGRFPQAQAVSVSRLGDSSVKRKRHTEVNDFAIPIPGGFASATSAFLLGPIDGATIKGSETMRVEGMLADTTVTVKPATITITDDDTLAPTFNTPRNVVLLLIDNLGWADTGVYGSPFHDTPHIDRLAAQGARFTQFYAASPVCSPTRASLMTGKHPARLHLTNWIGGEQQGALLQAPYERTLHTDETTIGEAFQQAGYATAYIGKWHLGQRTGQGFDYMRAVNDAGQPGSYFPPYKDNSFPHSNVPNLEGDGDDAYLTDRLTDLAVTFLETSQTQPFFLVLSHYAVHTPIESRKAITRTYEAKAAALPASDTPAFLPEGTLGRTKQRQDHPVYAGMIKSVDESVGRILELLDRLELADNTVVVFVSDNGGLSTLQDDRNGAPTSNLPLRAGKGLLYEGGIRIPMIIRDPGNISGGQVIDTPAMTTDLYPTMLSLTNLPLRTEQHTDGMDLSPLLTGKTTTLPQRMLYWHFPHYHGSGNRPTGAIRDGAYKMIEWFEDGRTELFHLEDDMGEAADLADDMPDKTRELRQALHRWYDAVDARMPTPSSITLSVSPSSVAENAARSVTVTARVDGRARFLQDQTLTVMVGNSSEDSAKAGTDYTAVNTVTITIAANAASGTGTFMLSPMNDSIFEGSETISVEGSVAGSAVTVTPATITITDDDTQSTALVLILDPNSVEEDVGTANVGVTVRLNADARPMPTPVTISVTDGMG